jgi:hypothetical protein
MVFDMLHSFFLIQDTKQERYSILSSPLRPWRLLGELCVEKPISVGIKEKSVPILPLSISISTSQYLNISPSIPKDNNPTESSQGNPLQTNANASSAACSRASSWPLTSA